jgi:hypothetical protein
MTKVKYWKVSRDEKEFEPDDDFYIEIGKKFVFFYGGGVESSMPKRLIPNIIKFLEKELNK